MRTRVPSISLWLTAALTIFATVAIACGSDDEDEAAENKRKAAGASTVFVPVDPPAQPPLPPGAGPYDGPKPTDKPDDPQPTQDSGTPPADSGTSGDAGDT